MPFDNLHHYMHHLAADSCQKIVTEVTQAANEFLVEQGLDETEIQKRLTHQIDAPGLRHIAPFLPSTPSSTWDPRRLTVVEREFEKVFGLLRLDLEQHRELNSFSHLLEALQGSPVALLGRGLGKHMYDFEPSDSQEGLLGDRQIKIWPKGSYQVGLNKIDTAISIITIVGAKRVQLSDSHTQEVVYFIDSADDDELDPTERVVYKVSYERLQGRVTHLVGDKAHLNKIWSSVLPPPTTTRSDPLAAAAASDL